MTTIRTAGRNSLLSVKALILATLIAPGLFLTGCGQSASSGDTSVASMPAQERANAEKGNAAAEYKLGIKYATGDGVTRDDAQAVFWFRKAAGQGVAQAQYNLGIMYLNGQGVAKDDTQAIPWFHKAAEQGYTNAQYNLGVMYRDGHGVAKDDIQAISWFRKAAEQGDAQAQKDFDKHDGRSGDGRADDGLVLPPPRLGRAVSFG